MNIKTLTYKFGTALTVGKETYILAKVSRRRFGYVNQDTGLMLAGTHNCANSEFVTRGEVTEYLNKANLALTTA